MKDLQFQLEIIEADTNWIVSCSSECGEALIRVPVPYSENELRSVLSQVESLLAKSYSPVVVRGASFTEKPVREFGARLTAAIFRDDILIQFDRCRSLSRTQGTPLRILLRTNGPHVARIPWEYLVDPSRDDYLALRVPVARCLRLMNRIPPLALTLPLRVLGISANPRDLPVLEGEKEGRQIAGALQRYSSDNVDVHWLTGDRWQDLARELRFGSWHVLHCVSHGGFDEERNAGYVQLSGNDGSARKIYASDFERLIADCPNLRLIVLNSCESAVSGSEDVFTSAAASLVRAGVPAVVAMQYKITDRAALVFASSFYERIAEGLPVDRAVTLAREDVKMDLDSLEWATPVLFLASDETRIFSVPDAQSGSPGPRPPPPGPPPPAPVRRLSHRIDLLADVGPCNDLALGPSGLVAAACGDGVVRVVNGVRGGLVAQCMPVQREIPVRVAWGPWRRHVASRHNDGTVVVWDLQSEKPVRVMNVGGQGDALAFSSDGCWLAVTVRDHVYVYNMWGARVRDLPAWPGKERAWQRKAWRGRLGPIAFAPGDRHVVVASSDGLVRQLDVRGQPVTAWPQPQPVLCLALTEHLLATGCADGRVRVWSWDGRLLQRTEHGRQPSHLAFASGFPALAVCDDDGTVTLWDLKTGALTVVAEPAHRLAGLAFLEGGQGLVTGTRAGAVERWSLPHWS